ncbi:Complement factor H [Dissostichus eleginoides]|uniref:Complement factor H n=1 Tax=Dissostichus eleginoides TaxID=100907 RepID=A0AAD9F5Z4_DISEL|nr:Complement factor H [Dissostichus eleginoides]
MCVRYLGFVLLVWNPQVLYDEKACVTLTIPNGKYDASTDGWYGERDRIWVRCDEGYEHKDRGATAQCINGAWSSVPICEKSTESCGDPPKIPHAVIIGKGYQEVFAVNSQLQYNCEDGYSAEGADTKTIICISGNWTEGPTCKITQSCAEPPKIPHAVIINREYQEVFVNDSTVQFQCEDGYAAEGSDTKTITCISGNWTEGPTCNANCGDYPSVPNGDVVQVNGTSLKYQCNELYTLEGPGIVTCQSNGKWTEPPSCKDWMPIRGPD